MNKAIAMIICFLVSIVMQTPNLAMAKTTSDLYHNDREQELHFSITTTDIKSDIEIISPSVKVINNNDPGVKIIKLGSSSYITVDNAEAGLWKVSHQKGL